MKHPPNALVQPLTPRKALAVLGLIGLVALVIFASIRGWRWWDGRPKSLAQQQRAVHTYLEKKSGRSDFKSSYDFNLRQTVATLQTNALRLRAEINLLTTNISMLAAEVRTLNQEATALTGKERAAKRQLATVAEKLSEQQRRLAVRLGEVSSLQSNVAVLTTNQSNEATRTAARMERLRTQVLAAQEVLASSQTNVAALEQQNHTADQEFTAQQAEAEARRSLLASRQAQLKAMQAKLGAQEKEWQGLRRETYAKEQSLNTQGNDFARQIRQTIKEAGSYETIYAVIGSLLWTSERLVASDEPRDQRQGAMFIDEAAQTALHSAEDVWLAARICEAQVWPNLGRFDLSGKGSAGADAVLGNCNGIFQRAGETNLVEKNYRLMLQHAQTPRRADAIRYNLGYLLEESGAWQSALEVYREIQDTNYFSQAQRRMTAVEQKRSGGP